MHRSFRVTINLEEAIPMGARHIDHAAILLRCRVKRYPGCHQGFYRLNPEVTLILVYRLCLSPRRLEQHLVAEDLDPWSDQPPHDLQQLRMARKLANHGIEPGHKGDSPN